jgi:hypothetical protein
MKFIITRSADPDVVWTPLLSGVTFGFFDKPVAFDVKSQDGPPLGAVRVRVVRDPTKKPYHISRHADERGIEVTFFNPSGGSSGVLGPLLLARYTEDGDPPDTFRGLALVFHIDVLPGADNFRMTYEFGVAPPSRVEEQSATVTP